MAKTILITGGAGFIGINAAKYYLEKNYHVIILDNFSRKGSEENLKWLLSVVKHKPKVIRADIVTDKKVLVSVVNASDIVLHLAAQVAVTLSIKNPQNDFSINAQGTLNVLEAVRLSKKKPILLYSSTNKVYGDLKTLKVLEKKTRYVLKDLPYGVSEKQPVQFKSPYGCSKGTADFYVQDYHTIYGLKTIVFRQSCIYGPRQFGVEDQGWMAWFMIGLLMGKQLTIYGNGKQVRDVLYIDDLIRGFDLAINNISTTNGQVYNIGGGIKNSISIWSEFAPMLEKLTQKNIPIRFSEMRSGDQNFFVADIRKAKKDFGWKPMVTADKGIARLYTWIHDNKDLFKHIK